MFIQVDEYVHLETIEQRITEFRKTLRGNSTDFILRKHITFGEAFIFEENRSRYFDLKAEIADYFKIHPSEVVMVGSAKLGFSIAQHKRYVAFNDKSDVDVAIICPSLFEKIWREVLAYQSSHSYWEDERDFKNYLFRGWIRPDMLPSARRFKIRKRWWDFFGGLTKSRKYGDYTVAGALYQSWYFFEKYQSICIKQCQSEEELSQT